MVFINLDILHLGLKTKTAGTGMARCNSGQESASASAGSGHENLYCDRFYLWQFPRKA
jgi:hypothetical protein